MRAAGRFGNPSILIGGLILAVLVIVGLTAHLVFPVDPFAMVGKPFLWPGMDPHFPLGTDTFGRDILVDIVFGARMTLMVGLAAAALSTGLGILVGILAGYFGGWVDNVLMRLAELFQTMPPLVFVITLVAILSPTIGSIVLAIGVTSWTQTARLIRAEALRIRESEYVQAANVMGSGHGRILLRHVLPNALSPVIVTSAILVGGAILTEAALSFLGLGDPNVMSWGSMIGAGRQVLRTAWYLTAIPGAAIVLAVVGFTILGNGLDQALSGRGGGRR